jgi:hypothetical protein
MAGSPIIVNLSTTDLNDLASWQYKDGQSQHGPDSYYTTTNKIINPILNIDSIFAKSFAGVGTVRTNEASSQGNKPNFSGGGVYYSRIEHPLPNTAINTKNTIPLTSLTNDFMTKARATGGVTMSLILHGKDDTTQQYSEAKYIQAAGADAPSFDSEFYRKSAYISFHSREAPQTVSRSLASNAFSLRKSFRYNFISIPLSQIEGMVLTPAVGGNNTIYSFGTLNWGNVAGLSAGALVTFSEIRLEPNANETLSADLVTNASGTPPRTVSCFNRTLKYIGFSGNIATFQNIHTSGSSSLFLGGVYQHTGYVSIANPNFGSLDIDQNRYVLAVPPVNFLRMRNQNSANAGNKNYLELSISTANTTRLFGGTDNLGIVAGSYIQISGSSIPSNNGIYEVLSVQDGVPGETNNVVSGAAGVQRYQYLELSRNITPESGTTLTIRNVSNLPILHIKYEYTP